ncbi:MAG: hypothetical protein C0620_06720 [Desulfuromonas sp.]|nr:MAG: hypothetical protein C0620_06720 [Desulfuromonas sp.]
MNTIIIDSIRKIKQLPPPSGLCREIIQIVSDEQVDLIDLVSIINKSPAITARILRCANSAYYGQRGEITTVREAIIRVLGLAITRSLSLAMALSGNFNIQQSRLFDCHRHWFNAVTTASMAQSLSHYLLVREKPAPSTAYTAGLLHNLGLQALVHCFPNEMEKVFASSQGRMGDRITRELGINHHQAATLLAQSWDLPDPIVKALNSLDEDSPGSSSPLTQLIWISSQLSDSLYLEKADPLATIIIPEETISPDHVQKVYFDTREQLEGLHEIALLITGCGGSHGQ